MPFSVVICWKIRKPLKFETHCINICLSIITADNEQKNIFNLDVCVQLHYQICKQCYSEAVALIFGCLLTLFPPFSSLHFENEEADCLKLMLADVDVSYLGHIYSSGHYHCRL